MRLDHVQIAAPPGCEGAARHFFGDLVGLQELRKPGALSGRGGVWFELGEQQLHVGVERSFSPARKAHPALRVSPRELDALARRLEAADAKVLWDDSLPGERRFYSEDPWGNRIEFLASRLTGKPPKGSKSMRVVVINHLSLDGVMQSPGRPDEDTRGGFSHGGWAIPGNDPAMIEAIGERMGTPGGGLLLGRRSYEDMLAHWNAEGGPFKEALNAAPKYVTSADPATQLDWPNSTLLHGDIPDAVADLKQGADGNLVIMGSGQLIRSLLPHGLIDEYLLMVHPLLLGTGQRLFDHDDHLAKLRLLDSSATSTGVIVAAYQPSA